MSTIAFDAEVLTRDWYSLSCRVVARLEYEDSEAQRGEYATVEHVEALTPFPEDAMCPSEYLIREGEDVTTLLDPQEVKRLQRVAQERSERERIGPLSWQYMRAGW